MIYLIATLLVKLKWVKCEYVLYMNSELCKALYTAHKKFMNGFACRGFDPYVTIISTSRCQKTPVCKSAK